MSDERQRLAERLEIIEAVVWACDHGHELLDIMMGSSTQDDARAEIMRVAGVSEHAANAIADVQVSRWVSASTEAVRRERDDLLEASARAAT